MRREEGATQTYLGTKVIGKTLEFANLAGVERADEVFDPLVLGAVERLQDRVLQLSRQHPVLPSLRRFCAVQDECRLTNSPKL